MWLILTHENADFDAVASQWAAHRLFPQGVPLLSRRINRNVGRFLAHYGGAFHFQHPDAWRRRRISRIVLVDTHALPSVRGVRPKTPVTHIDHHVRTGDHPDWDSQVEPVGATTTLLVERLQAQAVAVNVTDATLFLLGIYEDTGRLTYDTTTARDAEAAAWLLRQGADLPAVRTFLDTPLSPAQTALYRDLTDSAEWLSIEDKHILLTATHGPDDFEDEISGVVNQLRDDFAPDALLVLVALPQRVHFVARSAVPTVDVAVIARALGGGGHGRAAAATVRFKELSVVRAEVKSLLNDAVQPIWRVADIMSHHVRTIDDTTLVAEAEVAMQRFGHEGYPVVDAGGRLVGLLTRRAVDRAVSHQLGHLSVRQVMREGTVTVRPSDSLRHLQTLMVRSQWGQVPVVDEHDPDKMIGVVTRTDVLRVTLPFEPPRDTSRRDQLRSALPGYMWQMVQVISRAAATLNVPLYFVGGLVRDVLLGKPAADIDFVVEGDAIFLVTQLVAEFGGKLYTHEQFGTAKWILGDDVWDAVRRAVQADGGPLWTERPPTGAGEPLASLDFVSARTEYYQEPTVLPTVARGAIKLDLLRRDFTINTLAIRLDGTHLGEMLDYYGGLNDLENGVIRILHSLSFIDDPTRILRAVRFEQRLDFAIEARTRELLESSLTLLKRVTGARIRHEIELCLREANPARVMARLAEMGVLEQLVPGLAWSAESAEYFARLPRLLVHPDWRDAKIDDTAVPLYFFLWLAPLPPAQQKALMDRLRVRNTTRQDMLQINDLAARLPRLAPDAPPSAVEKTVRPFAEAPRVLLTARVLCDGTHHAAQLDRYHTVYRHVRPALTGKDVRAAGLPPGPQYAVILDRLLAARLDGTAHSEADERALLAQLIAAA